MDSTLLKSTQFRREREPSWRELEALLEKLRKGSPRSLSPQEFARLSTVCRNAVSSHSGAITFDECLLTYLKRHASCGRRSRQHPYRVVG